MSRFAKLQDFERRFETMRVDELKRWRTYWTQHAQGLAPKVRKQAMKRVYDIEKALGADREKRPMLIDSSPNQPLEPMTRSAVTFLFQIGRLWRAPRHGSAHRSATR